MTDLERYRDEIDEIDSEIVRLFEKRMKVSEEVAEYKIKTGKQVLDPARESQKIHTLKNKAHGDFNSLGVQELFRQIMAISRKRQYQLLTEHGIYGERNFTTVKHVPLENATVVFQGVEGAYSYAAMRQYFGKNIESYHVKTWRTAMEDVTHGKADYAVLPIENSTAGIVADIYDLLMEYKLYIVGEQIIRVDHVLLGMPDAQIGDIREVCSHPQGLAQCKAFLEENPSWKKKEVENTAGAAKKVSEVGDKGVAAIASREAGEVFGLKVLAENICREKANSTRFIIVSRKPEYEEKAGKISICFETPHTSGSLLPSSGTWLLWSLPQRLSVFLPPAVSHRYIHCESAPAACVTYGSHLPHLLAFRESSRHKPQSYPPRSPASSPVTVAPALPSPQLLSVSITILPLPQDLCL